MITNIRALRCAMLVGTAAMAHPALAQSAAPAAAAADDATKAGGLEEIVVTANKREENLQKTPVAITAITAAVAEFRGIAEVKDISSLAPNVTVLQGTTNATAAVVTIRGIPTAGDESQGFDSPIGIYLDGVYLARSSAASSDVADIERIEVLRGPQGTLFGRNTTGGAVNFITREPSKTTGLTLKEGVGNYKLFSARGTFDTGQIGDVIRMSIGGTYKRRNGTVNNLLQPDNSQDPGAYESYGFRIATVIEPGSGIKITNIFDYNRIKGINTASQFAAAGNGVLRTSLSGYSAGPTPGTILVNGGTFALVQPAPVGPYLAQASTAILEGPICSKTPATTRLNALCSEGAAPYIDKSYGDLLRIELDLGFAKLRSSSSYRRWTNIQTGTDLDGLGTIRGAALGPSSTTLNGFPAAILANVLQLPAGTAAFLSSQPVFSANVSLFQTVNDRRQHQYSQELELISSKGDKFNWVLGGFFFHEAGFEKNPQSFGFILDTNQAVFNATNFGGAAPFLQATNPARYRAAIQNTTLGYNSSGTSYAIYGQGTYRPDGQDGKLGVTLGLRYTWDRKHFARFQNGATPYTLPADIALNDQRANFSAPTGNLTIDYRATDEVNLYARVARGYRSGGFNARQATAANFGLVPFNNETIWSYELGMKTEFSHKLRFNAAAFFNNYGNLQVAVPVPIVGSGSFGTVVANAGKVEYYGIEFEAEYHLNNMFWVDGNFGYTHQKYKQYKTLDANGVATNIASVIQPSYSPKYTASAGANARIPLRGDATALFRLGYNYTSSFFLFGNAIAAPFQNETNGDARGLLDAQLKLSGGANGPFKDISLSIWGKNLTQKEYRVRSVDFGQLGFAYTVYGEPRTFGATLEVKF